MRPIRVFVIAACAASIGYGCGETECSTSDRTGTYLVTSTSIGGTCGNIDPVVTQFSNGVSTNPDPACQPNYTRWSEDECSLQTSITCTYPPDNLMVTGVGQTDQEDSEGDKITGTLSMTMKDLNGATVCTGTYDVTYERQ